MPTDDHQMKIEGAPSKPYKLYRTGLNDEIISLVAEAGTQEELSKLHKRRLPGPGVRARSARKGAREDRSRPSAGAGLARNQFMHRPLVDGTS